MQHLSQGKIVKIWKNASFPVADFEQGAKTWRIRQGLIF
jgi:hypothetical protein